MLKINKIKELCRELPYSDMLLAFTLIEKRDFIELEALIKSVIVLIDLNNIKSEPRQEISSLDESKIMELYNLVLDYKSQLVGVEDDD